MAFKKGHIPWHKGKSLSKEHRKKISESLRGKSKSKEAIKKASETKRRLFREGKLVPWNKGKTNVYSKEVLRRISETRKRLFKKGKLNGFEDGHTPWSKGLTKKTDVRLKGMGEKHRGEKNATKRSEVRRKMKECHWSKKEGFIPSMLGKHHSEKTKKKISKRAKKRWKTPKFAKRMSIAYNRRPNKIEKILIRFLKENNLPYKYVGDGKIWIEGRNPDFINCNGKKRVIELFGDYWHTERAKNFWSTEWGRKLHYKKYGFDCLVIWESELNNLDSVRNKISEFCGGNVK